MTQISPLSKAMNKLQSLYMYMYFILTEDCTPPVVPNSNYNTQKPDVNHNTTINITCDPGYSTGSLGSYQMFCDNGALDVPPPACFGNIYPRMEKIILTF